MPATRARPARTTLDAIEDALAAGEFTEADALALVEQLEELHTARHRANWHPYPWQVAPGHIPAQGTWLQLGGRGTGKTDGAARYVIDHIEGPPCDRRLRGGHRIGVVAPTIGDAVESCIEGPSGLKAHDPRVLLRGGTGGHYVRFPNGVIGKLFGGHTPDDIERLRSGGNRCIYWLEECAAMRQLGGVLEHAAFGLRIGATPHFVASTTPKPRPELRDLIADPLTIITRGRTAEAIHLDAAVRAVYERKYGGTRLGRQELEGEVLEDVEGALWTWGNIDRGRVDEAPELLRACVAIDPSVSVTESSDECGIVAVGLGIDRVGYVLADRSAKVAGVEAARRAWQCWADLGCNYVVYEGNQGKKWVGDVLRQVWAEMQREGTLPGGAAPLREVTAVVGKRLRAEPVASLYELDPPGARHVGAFEELEDQMTTWVPESGESPDRIDALVHGLTDLVGHDQVGAVAAPGGTISGITGARNPYAGGNRR